MASKLVADVSRINWILLGVALLQGLLLFLLPDTGAGVVAAVERKALFLGLMAPGENGSTAIDVAKAVASVTIRDDHGNRIVLQRSTDDPKKWVIASLGNYPVRENAVKELIQKIADLRSGPPRTEAATEHEALGVSAGRHVREIRVTTADGADVAHVYVGRRIGVKGGEKNQDPMDFSAAASDRFLVRAAASDAVYAGGLDPDSVKADADSWGDRNYFKVEKDDVAQVRVAFDDTVYALEKRPRARAASESAPESAPAESGPVETDWHLVTTTESAPAAGTILDTGKVDSLLWGLTSVYASKLVGAGAKPEHGFDKPRSTVTLTMKDGRQHTLTVGAKTGQEWYLRWSGSEFVVTLAEYSIDGNFRKKLADLLPQPETPGVTPNHRDDGHGH